MKILKELREKSGLTLRQVETATSISNAYLSQLENGKIKKPSAQALYVLAKLYDTSIETLLIESGMVIPKDVQSVSDLPAKSIIMKSTEIRIIEDRISKLESKVLGLEFNHITFR